MKIFSLFCQFQDHKRDRELVFERTKRIANIVNAVSFFASQNFSGEKIYTDIA